MMNRQNLNKLNSVLLVCQNDVNLYYEAYLQSEISQKTTMRLNDMPFAGMMESYMAGLFTNHLGYAPGISFNRIATFKGSMPTSLELITILKLKTDFKKDIKVPLSNLFDICLPDDGITIREGADALNITNVVATIRDRLANFIGHVPIVGETVQNMIGGISDIVSTIADNTTLVKIPKMIEPNNHLWCYVGTDNPSERGKANIVTGPWLIETLEITLGKLIIDGGYPETVKVEIGLTSLRTQATHSAFSMFKEDKKNYPNEIKEIKRDPFVS